MHFILSNIVSNNQPRKIGSIADIDPLNGVYGSGVDYTNYALQQQHQLRYTPQQQQQQQQQSIQQQIQQNQQSAIQQKPKSISSQVVSDFLFQF